jgi:hypothetical protein
MCISKFFFLRTIEENWKRMQVVIRNTADRKYCFSEKLLYNQKYLLGIVKK